MRSTLLLASLLAAGCSLAQFSPAQDKPAHHPSDPAAVRLALKMKIATRTADGLPAEFRLTLTNRGRVPVDLPKPGINCAGDPVGEIMVEVIMHAGGQDRRQAGGNCGGSYMRDLSIVSEIRRTWIHLRPGESLTFTRDSLDLVEESNAPASYEFHAVYRPPDVTAEERTLATKAGYVIPSQTVESNRLKYRKE